MADINKLKDKIKSTIYPNGKGAINASDHQAMLLDMADGMAETDTKLAELSAEINNFDKTLLQPYSDKFHLTQGAITLKLPHTYFERVLLRIKSNGVITYGGDYTLNYLQGNTTIATDIVYADTSEFYRLSLPSNCDGLSIYIGRSTFVAEGDVVIETYSDGLGLKALELEKLISQIDDVQVASLFAEGNIIDKSQLLDGFSIKSNGTKYVSANTAISGYVKVSPSDTLVRSYNNNPTAIILGQYDASLNFIRQDVWGYSEILFNVTDSTEYVVFVVNITEKDSFCVYNGSKLNPFKLNNKGVYFGAVSEYAQKISEMLHKEGCSENLLSWESPLLGLGIDPKTKQVVTSVKNCLSQKIPVLPCSQYIYNVTCLEFDANDNIIDAWDISAGNKHITSPTTAYIRATTGVSNLESSYLVRIDFGAPEVSNDFTGGDFYPSHRLNLRFIKEYSKTDRAKGYVGKKLSVDGDSITHDLGNTNYWQYVLANNLGMQLNGSSFIFEDSEYIIGKQGIGGSRIAVGEENNTKPYCIVKRYQDLPSDSDVIVIAGGTNDWAHSGVLLGTMEDREIYTFYGALHTLCVGLIEKYPSGQIVFMTPIKRDALGMLNEKGNTLEEFANAIIEVCGYYGIPVCDLFHKCAMNPSIPAQQALYFGNDRTHPNAVGQKKMGDMVSGFIDSLL